MLDTQTLIFIGAALLLGALMLRRASRARRFQISLGSISEQWLAERKWHVEEP
jgi:hypothetical protein